MSKTIVLFACALPWMLTACALPEDDTEASTDAETSGEVEADDTDELADEAVGVAEDAVCLVPNAPPSGFVANVQRSLDGAVNIIHTDGKSASGACAFYTVDVDTSPDRAGEIGISSRTDGRCGDVVANEQQAYMWQRFGSGPYYTWTVQTIGLHRSDRSDDDGDYCSWSAGGDVVAHPNATRVIVGARFEESNNTAAEARIGVLGTDFDWTSPIVQSPACPVGSVPPIDVNGTFDGTTEFEVTGYVAWTGCDLFTAQVVLEATPEVVSVFVRSDEVCPNLDYDTLQAHLWTTTSTAPPYAWTSQPMYLSPYPLGNHAPCGLTSIENDIPPGTTRMIIAGRAKHDNGSPVELTLRTL